MEKGIRFGLGVDSQFVFQLQDENGNAENLTGATAASLVVKSDQTTIIGTFTVTLPVDLTTGTLTLNLAAAAKTVFSRGQYFARIHVQIGASLYTSDSIDVIVEVG